MDAATQGKRSMSLSTKMLIGFCIGVALGVVLQSLGWNLTYIKLIGDVFVKAVKMLIVPLLVGTMIVGTASISDISKLGRVALKAGAFYLVTTAAAILFGIFAVRITNVGVGMGMGAELAAMEGKEFTGFADTILNLIPDNPVAAMANGNLLQIILFSVIFGIALVAAGEKGKPLLRGVQALTDTMFEMIAIVMKLAPIGVCALMTYTIAEHGLATIIPLMGMLAVCYGAMILFAFVFYIPTIVLYAKIPLRVFLKVAAEPSIVAASTNSSMAAMASNMIAAERIGVSGSIASFLISLGNTVNMAGTAMSLGILASFVANAYGITLTVGDQLTIVITGVMLAVGAVGVPSYQLVLMTAVFPQVGLPLAGVTLVSGVDSIRGMISTALNVFGDLVVAIVVAKSENELDRSKIDALIAEGKKKRTVG